MNLREEVGYLQRVWQYVSGQEVMPCQVDEYAYQMYLGPAKLLALGVLDIQPGTDLELPLGVNTRWAFMRDGLGVFRFRSRDLARSLGLHIDQLQISPNWLNIYGQGQIGLGLLIDDESSFFSGDVYILDKNEVLKSPQ